ncbi:MAG: hypothetical protein IJ418_00845 [Clostridia bacterium]|nr:hypothetical protein [Clostridia bacterium]
MKIIASADYYTESVQEMEALERRLQGEPAYKGATEQRDIVVAEQMKQRVDELSKTLRIRPRRLGFIRFYIVAKNAHLIAEGLGADMRAIQNVRYGRVYFYADEFLADKLWKDHKSLRLLLKYSKWADSVSIALGEADREGQCVVELTFRLCRLTGKGKDKYKNLEKLLF